MEATPQVSNSNFCKADQCSYKYLFISLSAGSASDVEGGEAEPTGVSMGTCAYVCDLESILLYAGSKESS